MLDVGCSIVMLAIDDKFSSTSLINPQALMTIRNLELRARVVVEGFWNGLHRSPYHGFSVEFTNIANTVPVMIPGIWTGASLPAAIAISLRNSRMKPIFVAICWRI